jgi:hypothetical protein
LRSDNILLKALLIEGKVKPGDKPRKPAEFASSIDIRDFRFNIVTA